MSCVNINHPEFKAQAQRLNISTGHLRNLQHQYQNYENTEAFASDEWIKDHLHQAPNIITSEAQMQLWWNKYSNPVIVDNPADYKAEVSKFFYPESVNVKELPDGRYECSVSTPVMKDSNGKMHTFNATPLKAEYKGKLIYAEAGTGKTAIADNVNVIDSDVILGDVLGVSRDTAGFFFQTLSMEQKEAFGKKYREEIKRKLSEGKTVLTANSSLLNIADVIVYNSSAKETNNRTSAADRLNKYDNLAYHEQQRKRIDEVENAQKIKLTAKEHLADKLLTDKSFKQETEKRATTLDEAVDDFLESFGMKKNEVESFSNDVSLFDALHRVINIRNAKDITDGIGYSIAFMMQHMPVMRKWMVHEQLRGLDVIIPEKTLNRMLQNPNSKEFTIPPGIAKLVGRKKVSLADIINRFPGKDQAFRSIGKQIATEWRNAYGKEIGKTPVARRIWNIITDFFNRLFQRERMNERKEFVQQIVDALGREDYSLIRGPRVKGNTTQKAELLNVEKAFKENPYEADIIKKLSNVGISITGSTAVSMEGTIYRPDNNPLHDIDFSTENGTTREQLEAKIKPLFPNLQHVRTIIGKGREKTNTETYLTMDREFTLEEHPTMKDFQYIKDKEGNIIGKMQLSKQELYLNEGIKGKLLDFFVGEAPNVFGNTERIINGEKYLVSNADNAMSAKIRWQRQKDVWDYAWYVPNKSSDVNTESSLEKSDEIGDAKEITKRIQSINEEINTPAPITKLISPSNLDTWLRDFCTPRAFKDKEAAMERLEKGQKMFGEDSCKMYYDSDLGVYVVFTGAPAKMFPFQLNNNLWKEMRQHLDSQTGPRTELFKAILDSYERAGKYPAVKPARIGQKVTLTNADGTSSTYTIQADATPEKIRIDPRETNTLTKRQFVTLLLHENIHATTLEALYAVEDGVGTQEQIEFYNEVNRLYELAKQSLGDRASEFYGMKNIYEFLSEAGSNLGFQKELVKIKDPESKKSIWNKILDAFSKFFTKYFGINIEGTVFESVIRELTNHIEGTKQPSMLDKARSEIYNAMIKESNTPIDITKVQPQMLKNGQQLLDFLTGSKFYSSSSYDRNTPHDGRTVIRKAGNYYRINEYVGASEQMSDLGPSTRESINDIKAIVRQLGYPENVIEVSPVNRVGEVVTINEDNLRQFNEDYYGKQEAQLQELQDMQDELDYDLLEKLYEKDPDLAKKVVNGEMDIHDAVSDYERVAGESIWGDTHQMIASQKDIEELSNIIDKNFYEQGYFSNEMTSLEREFPDAPKDIALAIQKYYDAETANFLTAAQAIEFLACVNPSLIPQRFRNVGAKFVKNVTSEVMDNNPQTIYVYPSEANQALVLFEETNIYSNRDNTLGIAVMSQRSQQEFKEEVKNKVDELIELAEAGAKIALPIRDLGENVKDPELYQYLKQQLSRLKEKLFELDMDQKSAAEQYGLTPEPLQTGTEGTVLLSEQSNEAESAEAKEQKTTESKDEKKTVKESSVERGIKQIQAIKNNGKIHISSQEIRETAESVATKISDMVTYYQQHPEEIFDIFNKEIPENKKAKEVEKIKGMTRLQLVNYIGADNIIRIAKEELFKRNKYLNPDENPDIDFDTLDKADIYFENFGGLVTLAADELFELEGFTFLSTMENAKATKGSQKDENSQDDDALRETKGNLQEHWQTESRTQGVLSSSQEIKRQLHQLEDIIGFDTQGNPIYNRTEFGIVKRKNATETTNKIINWTQGMINYQDMLDKLQAQVDKNPWLKPLIQKLTIIKGQENPNAVFQSQFFTVMCKHHQNYNIIIKEKGVLKSIPANTNPLNRDVKGQLQALQLLGNHPLLSNGKIDLSALDQLNALSTKLQQLVTDKDNKQIKDFDQSEVFNTLKEISKYLGYEIPAEASQIEITGTDLTSMRTALSYILKTLKKNKTNSSYDVNEYRNGIAGNVVNFIKPFQDTLGLTRDNVTYDNGKTYQEYVAPSYMTKLVQKIANSTQEKFQEFLEEEYGKSEWFRNSETGEWEIEILEWLANMTPEQRKAKFDHTVQLSFDGKNYMKDMLPEQYAIAALAQYFTDRSAKSAVDEAFYKIPMLSNKPSFEFIKFKRYQGDFSVETESVAKAAIVDGLMKIARQEIKRIATFNLRSLNHLVAEISSYEENGKKFVMLDFLEKEREDGTQLGKLLDQQIKLAEDGEVLDIYDSTELVTLMRKSIIDNIDARVSETINNWRTSGLIESMKNIKGLDFNNVEGNLREFLWNDMYASANILELTITDPAMYKNAVDLQKRLAEIHAPGTRANVLATDFKGNRVSDGLQRTFYLKDIEDFVSNICDNVAEVLDRKINARGVSSSEKAGYEQLKHALVRERVYNADGTLADEGGLFRNINVADAQGFSAPTAYRKKAFMFGKWSEEAEAIYEKILSGDYEMKDVQRAFQPLKPFVYSQVFKSSEVDAPITSLKVGVQNKNSEYLLLMAGAILHGEKTSRPNLLQALFNFMEDSAYTGRTRDANGNVVNQGVYNRKGIDTIQFESAVKVGKMKTIDLTQFENSKDAYDYMMNIIGNAQRGYNADYVFELPFEDYAIQQEIPEHFLDHAQLFGSQVRYVLNSDLAHVNSDGSIAKYDYYDPRTGEHKSLTAKQYKAEFEKIVSENIEESVETLRQELRLNGSIKEQNIRIANLLREEIINSPRYGIELLDAVAVDADGNFIFPLSDPIQSKRIEQLLYSIIKNRINKQKIAGGPLVQASNFGFSTELNIVFKDKAGGTLLNKAEWLKQNEGKTVDDYKNYIKEHQGGIAYYECFAPIYSKELFAPFMDEKGEIDTKAIEESNPEILEMIGYRIPTEAKYSVAPLRIVGFTPALSGDLIILPNDITTLTGSDFDIDKFYVMVREFSKNIREVDAEQLKQKVIEKQSQKSVLSEGMKESIGNMVDVMLANIEKAKNKNREYKPDEGIQSLAYREWQKLAYEFRQEGNGVAGRNNTLFNMSYGLMTHENSADQILNPGGFDPQKKIGYMMEAARRTGLPLSELRNKSIKELSKLAQGEDNLLFFGTNQKFYKQNVVAGAILGMFAVQKTAHSVFEGDGLSVRVSEQEESVNLEGFAMGDFRFRTFLNLDAQFNSKGELIGKILGSLVASAADAVKDPVLNLMNINNQTAPILTALIRCGMTFENAALFLSQKAITDIISRYNKQQMKEGYASFEDVIQDRLAELIKDLGIESGNKLWMEDISEKELETGLRQYTGIEEFKILNALNKLHNLYAKIKGTTTLSRLNSITSAVGPQIINTLMNKEKMNTAFPEKGGSLYKGGERVTTETIFRDHPILRGFYQAYLTAERVFGDKFQTYSGSFRSMASTLGIITKEKRLQEFSDFFLSYLFFKNDGERLVKEQYNLPQDQGLEYYIEQFPNEFIALKQSLPENLKDNLLLKSIGLTANRKGHVYLQIQSIGLDKGLKNQLSAAWEDLHYIDPQLSAKLFLYNIYKTGTKFSPFTFLSLCPVSIKQQMGNYSQTYLKGVSFGEAEGWKCMIDFVRHNPKAVRLYENLSVIQEEGGNVVISNAEGMPITIDDLVGEEQIAIRAEVNDVEKLIVKDTDGLWYVSSQLGNDGEYFEYGKELRQQTLAEKRAKAKAEKAEEQKKQAAQNPQQSQGQQQQFNTPQDYEVADMDDYYAAQAELYEAEDAIQDVNAEVADVSQEVDVEIADEIPVDTEINVEVADDIEVDAEVVDVDDLVEKKRLEESQQTVELADYYNENLRETPASNSPVVIQPSVPKQTTPQNTQQQFATQQTGTQPFTWSIAAKDGYDVSTNGDRRFSDHFAKFPYGTIINGIDVGNKNIRQVYDYIMTEKSYEQGYLPLWREWAKHNSYLINELRQKAAGKPITDRLAKGNISSARALADILNETAATQQRESQTQTAQELTPAQQQQRIQDGMRQNLQQITNEDVIDTSDIDDSAATYC